jgi:hypothetical protein
MGDVKKKRKRKNVIGRPWWLADRAHARLTDRWLGRAVVKLVLRLPEQQSRLKTQCFWMEWDKQRKDL